MRSVTIESFGEMRDERRVVLIRITNGNGMRVELLNLGASVRSIVVPDREGVLTDVALGFDTVKAYENDRHLIGTTLGRVAGRIRDARYAIDSREYFLAQNDHPHHRNGGAKSPLSKKIWNYTLLEEGNGVVFTVRSHDGDEGYPGNAIVQVSYVLTNHNEILVQYSANTDKSTLMNLSSNFYLNLDGNEVQACLGLQRNRQNLIWFKNTISSCMRFDAGMELDGIAGKEGNNYKQCSAFVVGCRGFEDACNQGNQGRDRRLNPYFQAHFPSISLRPDQLYQHITIYRFSLIE
ncbi:unnamed protein product [Haemonchus placei]|uniref:Galactose mutarotase n=1 Tax=Haemonchus placei TaxID=6290 RepID=A0A158QN49_HAEPC|nr:unnamed protein product [Haemonchus placei]